MSRLAIDFATDHPVGAGHFPGRPIIPGALLLDRVLAAIAADAGLGGCAWQVATAKFPHPVVPGDRVEIELAPLESRHWRFVCTVGERRVLTGEARAEDASA